MKKLLFMVSSMNIGGVEKSLLSLISVIPKNKYKITILVLEKKGGFLKQIPDWIKVEEVDWYKKIKPIIMQPPQRTIKDYYKKQRYIKALFFLFIYLISKYFNNRHLYYKYVLKDVQNYYDKYDIAISYQGPTDIMDYYIGKKVTAKKKISWVHFDVSKHEMNEQLYKKLYKNFSKIFVVSKEAKGKLKAKFPSISEKTEVFSNIISKRLINEMSQEKVDFDEDYQGIRIVTVGRLSSEKGQDLAIKTLYKLRQDGYEVRWYCIGEGNERQDYEQMVENYGLKENFILLGSKVNPYPYIARSDIYVQPSRHEGYCLTLAEARCLHKPIITTNFTGANEQIKHNETGLIVEIDVENIFQALTDLMNNPKRCQQFSNNLIKENFNIPIQKEKIDLLI